MSSTTASVLQQVLALNNSPLNKETRLGQSNLSAKRKMKFLSGVYPAESVSFP